MANNVPEINLNRDIDPPIRKATWTRQGSFATIYESKLIEENIKVAVKLFNQNRELQNTEYFEKELSVISRLINQHHQNVVKYYGVCRADKSKAIVMEFCGLNLYQFIQGRKHKQKQITNGIETSNVLLKRNLMILQAIARGLSFLHSKGISHRDLHPGNILISAKNEIKLTDVGISKILSRSSEKDSDRGGPVAYLAPEVHGGRIHISGSDMFSFGVIAWQLWTLDSPWEGWGPLAIMNAVKAGKRLDIPQDMPEFLHDLIQCCWLPDYRKRPIAEDVVNICKMELQKLEYAQD